ncbi:DUF2339 domain-containing protein [Jeotgalibacillus sp. S-D1]|uniref:DUF2339 domain-containing protein n=1 Tax=Jeotgalibacillus sp. S-D1 TaxID=2552189 RepID=UPI001059DF9B|nr:DUF2339 domain-containing protein [Jeotgalibacillus sp. S-D1]TDL31866.1 DUF2339 domain-containing protein [Jeotgalibacillus sp. S-D1]
MEDLKEQLIKMRMEQAKLAKEFDAAIKEYESNDMLKENQLLRKSDSEFRQKLHDLNEKHRQLEMENQKLRYALQEQMLDEKLSILKVSKQKIHTYFGNKINPEQNRLKILEDESKREIMGLKERTNKAFREEKQSLLNKIEALSIEINESIKTERAHLAKREEMMLEGFSERYDELAAEELTEEVIQKRVKQNQIEMKIGLNWINKLGILLIIFGVAAAFRHSYTNWFNDYIKGGMFFVLGLLMLAGGEWLYRKNKQTFALGLIGGGVSVLYGSIFFCYFLLEIIGLAAALGLSVIVTAAAVVLSLRYHSRTIISFGLIGGYIPFYSYLFAFGINGAAVYAAMAYILILNLSILWISFQKQWSVVHYISFLCNIPSLLVLLVISPSNGVSMLYSVLTFSLYLIVTIGYPFKHKVALKWLDVTLLAFNTFISCLVMYSLFNALQWEDFRGLLALAFCVLYFGLGRFVERTISREKGTMVLFYGTSITFAVLIIPFQFGVEWLALGWLVESVVIMLYANRYKLALLEKAGWVIFSLTLFTFLMEIVNNLTLAYQISPYFNFKYFMIMAGLVLVTVYYVLDQTKKDSTYLFKGFPTFILGLKYFTLANIWIYLLYESTYRYNEWVPVSFSHFGFYKWLMIASISIGLSYVFKKVTLLYDEVVSRYCLALYAIGSFIGLVITFTIPALEPFYNQNTFVHYLALAILIGFNILIFLTGRDLLVSYILRQYKNYELYPTILSVYLLGILAAFLNVQFRLGDVGFVFSLVFLVVAVGYILYGFKKRYVSIRRIGLGLTLLTTGKLFLYDLIFLAETSKIVAYFCFGIMLLGISYIYQKVSSRQKEAEEGEEAG